MSENTSTAVSAISWQRLNKFIRFVQHRYKFPLYLLWKLPSAWLSGVRVVNLYPEGCTTTVPYKWLSQNPFRSTYFACLAMAAEMSTGLLAMMYVDSSAKRISMLVTNIEATYVKKAVGKTWFICKEGEAIHAAIAKALTQEEAVAVTVNSEGKSKDGTLIASFRITWSFKCKS
jgi:hypothetical protein